MVGSVSPFALYQPSEHHADDESPTTKDDMHRHRYLVSERRIVQVGHEVEQRNLDEVGE